MGGLRHAKQHRPHLGAAGEMPDQAERDARGLERRHDQEVCLALEHRVRKDVGAQRFRKREFALHLALDLELGRQPADRLERLAHLHRRGGIRAAEIRMRQERDLGHHAEAAHLARRQHRHLGDLLGVGVESDVGVGHEVDAFGEHQHLQRRRRANALAKADDVEHMAQVLTMAAHGARQHGLGLAAADHQRRDHRVFGAQNRPRLARRDAGALHDGVILRPVVAVARVVLGIDQIEVDAALEAQPELLDVAVDDGGAADEDRPGEALVADDLHRLQHPPLLALGVDQPPGIALGRLEHGLHDVTGAEHAGRQLLAVRLEVVDRARRDAAFHRRLGHRRRDLDHQPRVERRRQDVLGTERQYPVAVSQSDDVGSLGQRHVGDGAHAGQLHGAVDLARAHVERAAEDEREAQDVVDLVRVVGTAGGDDRVGPRLARELGQNFRHRIGERQNERLARHGFHHFGREYARDREAEKDVGALDRLGEGPQLGVAGEARLVGIHALLAARVDDALAVADDHVLARDAELDEKLEAGDRRGAGARARERNLLGLLADQTQAVEDRRVDADRGAVLVVVEDRNVHPLLQLRLDLEALGRLDVLEVDGAEGRLEAGDDVDQLVRIALVDLEVEDVDAGELLEQNRLAFHHRLRRQRADRAETEHGGAVADDGHHVAPAGDGVHLGRVAHDLLAGGGDAGRVGQRQVALGGERLGRMDGQLAGRRQAVELERGFAQFVRLHPSLRGSHGAKR